MNLKLALCSKRFCTIAGYALIFSFNVIILLMRSFKTFVLLEKRYFQNVTSIQYKSNQNVTVKMSSL